MKTFQVGATYSTRSACDYDCVFSWRVVARTAKQITLENRHGETSIRGIRVYGETEYCAPLGSYSMAPLISADRPGEIG